MQAVHTTSIVRGPFARCACVFAVACGWALVTAGAAEPPQPLAPTADEVVHAPHPHFRWLREDDVRLEETHRIQIARDESFQDLVCDDTLAVVSRFVPREPLAPGRHWWRVRRGAGPWSEVTAFEMREPARRFVIRAGSDDATVAGVMREAAAGGPARVDFEAGEYRLATDVPKGKSAVSLKHVRDLILDGHGARLVVKGTLLAIADSERVTIRDFTVTPATPGHTLVRIARKDATLGRLLVTPESAYDPDVPRFFQAAGNGGSFLGCMDVAHHGRYLPGAGVSAREAAIAASSDEPGAFVIAPVKPAVLERMPLGATAVVTMYGTQWVQIDRTAEATFSGVTVSGLPGAFCGGSDNPAKSYLGCRVLRARPEDYFGGHSAVENARIGPWVEGCLFECLPDDGPALQSLRMTILRADGDDAVIVKREWTSRELRAGDRIAILDPKDRGALATVRAVGGTPAEVRVQIDRPLADIAAPLRRAADADWGGLRLYREAPSNEDFVYRRNRHVGGRGHGVKFNGTRALIADNHFENISGNAVVAGFTWQGGISGHGASDVVVSGNTIVRCGWTPIEARGIPGIDGNIVITGNRITETRDAGVFVRGCDRVRIEHNEFASSTAPSSGGWVVTRDAHDLWIDANRHSAEVPIQGSTGPKPDRRGSATADPSTSSAEAPTVARPADAGAAR